MARLTIILAIITSASAAVLETEADGHLTIFENLGELIPNSAYIHVVIPVDLRNYRQLFLTARELLRIDCQNIHNTKKYQDLRYYNSNLDNLNGVLMHPQRSNSTADAAGLSIAHQLDNILAKFDNIVKLMPQEVEKRAPNSMHRSSRSITAIVFGGIALIGILGTLFGLYSQKQLSTITIAKDLDLFLHIEEEHQDMINNLNKRLNLAMSILSEDHKADVINRQFVWLSVIEQLNHRLKQFHDFVTELQRHRLSMTWLTPKQMETLHQEVASQAQLHGLIPLPTHLSDYAQLEVSYLKSDKTISAILHVPTSSSKFTWTIYKYIPFPILLDNSTLLSVQAKDEIIAVGPDHNHKVLSRSQFERCLRRNHIFICESPLITATNFSTSCVGALMDHNQQAIEAHCTLHHLPIQEMVFQTAADQFAIFSPLTYTARGACHNGTAISALISKTSKVTVPNGCTLNLRQHSLSVPINVIATLTPWVQETKWDILGVPRKLLQESNQRTIKIQRLLQNDSDIESIIEGQLLSTVKHLQDAHERLEAQLQQAQELATYVTIAVALAISFIVIGLCVCLAIRFHSRIPSYHPKSSRVEQIVL